MILSEKSAIFRDHALTTDNLTIGYNRQKQARPAGMRLPVL
jgi:hypothetical protein